MTEKEKTQGFTVADKSVCIVGCGGLGCNAAVHLAGAGVGKIILCDFDKVSPTNLNRQFIYTAEDVGKSKCFLAEEFLTRYAPEAEIIAEEKKICSVGDMSFAKECDIIICAVDNSTARKLLQEFSLKENIPLVCGGIDGFYGVAYLYIPHLSPCPDCACLNENVKAQYNVSATAGIIGSLQSALAIKYLLTEDKALSGKLIVYDEDRFDTLKIQPTEGCDECKLIK